MHDDTFAVKPLIANKSPDGMCVNRIYNEDCLHTMSRMPDGFVDLVLTSPPYNMNLRIRNGKYCSRQVIPDEFSTKYNGFSDNLPIDEFYELHSRIIDELLRVSSLVFYVVQVVTGSKRAFFRLIGEKNEYLKEVIVWDKMHGQPAMQSGVLNRRSELILVFEKDGAIARKFTGANFPRGTLDDIWEIPRGNKVVKEHGAVFPEKLAERVVTNFSNIGDVVYDPFLGTGTTAKVALVNGRRYIGSDISTHYCNVAKKRIAECEDKLREVRKVN